MKPGEAVVLNNHRVLHARNAFKTNGGERHIQVLKYNILHLSSLSFIGFLCQC